MPRFMSPPPTSLTVPSFLRGGKAVPTGKEESEPAYALFAPPNLTAI